MTTPKPDDKASQATTPEDDKAQSPMTVMDQVKLKALAGMIIARADQACTRIESRPDIIVVLVADRRGGVATASMGLHTREATQEFLKILAGSPDSMDQGVKIPAWAMQEPNGPAN